MPEIIEWKKMRKDDIVYRWPNDLVKWGSQCLVRENQAAVFYRDGKALDVMGVGRHTLTTANVPILTGILRRIAGFDRSPFNSEVVFLNMTKFQGKFGGKGQTRDLAPLMFHGEFWFEIDDAQVFVNEVVAGENYTTQDVTNFIRSKFVELAMDELSGYSLQMAMTRLDETSMKTKTELADKFEEYGLKLLDMAFAGMDTSPEYRERLFFAAQGVTGQQVLTAETMRRSAEALGQGGGSAAAGSGIVLIPQLADMMRQSQKPQDEGVTAVMCPYCGEAAPLQKGKAPKFCPNCGKVLRKQVEEHAKAKKFCPNCGAPAKGKFCAECGEKL
ncbi:MAG: SPFH domain-containing protein [Candidatus Thorarchaeota archaeon]